MSRFFKKMVVSIIILAMIVSTTAVYAVAPVTDENALLEQSIQMIEDEMSRNGTTVVEQLYMAISTYEAAKASAISEDDIYKMD